MWIAVIVLLLGFLLSSCDRGEPVTPDEKPDTTSYNFTWQVERLGVGSSSVLEDVAIVNDTLFLAVGELYLNDSTGEFDPKRYNYAAWDGRAWSVRRLPYDYQGRPFVHPIKCVFSLGPNDIWFGGNGLSRWNGATFVEMPIAASVCGASWIRKIWAASGQDVYIVGDDGAIAHFDGIRWEKLSSGITLPMRDIWGSHDAKTGETEVQAVAGEPYVSSDRKILKISGTGVTSISDSGIAYALTGTWFSPNVDYWVVGDGIYHKTGSLNAPRWEGVHNRITPYFTNAIRGTAANDLFVVGALGELLYFNGSTWVSYRDQTGVTMGPYYSVAFKATRLSQPGTNPRMRSLPSGDANKTNNNGVQEVHTAQREVEACHDVRVGGAVCQVRSIDHSPRQHGFEPREG
jgi:hypothetical protein